MLNFTFNVAIWSSSAAFWLTISSALDLTATSSDALQTHIDRHTDRHTSHDIDRQRYRYTCRETHRHTHTNTDTYYKQIILTAFDFTPTTSESLQCCWCQSCLDSPPHSPVRSSLLSSPLSSSITLSLQAQNLPFQQILPTLDFFYLSDCLHDNGTGLDLSCSSFYF